MSCIFYFVPVERAQLIGTDEIAFSREVLKQFDLQGVLADVHRHPRDCLAMAVPQGPSGGPGTVLAPISNDMQPPRFNGERVAWRERGSCWLGYDPELPPLSHELMRRRIYVSYTITGEDSQTWFVPIARSSDASRVSLPSFVVMDAGRVSTRIKPRFEGLWAAAGEYLKFLTGEESLAHSREWQFTTALEALSVNYRLDWPEVTLLAELDSSPLDTGIIDAVLKSLVDEQILQEDKKKDLPGNSPSGRNGSRTDRGEPANSPDTVPAGASSS